MQNLGAEKGEENVFQPWGLKNEYDTHGTLPPQCSPGNQPVLKHMGSSALNV